MGFKKEDDDYDAQVAKCDEAQEKFEMVQKSMDELMDQIQELRVTVANSRADYHLATRDLDAYKAKVEAAEKKKEEWLQLQSKLSGLIERWQGHHVSYTQIHVNLIDEEKKRKELKKKLKKDFKQSLKSKMTRSKIYDE